MHTQESGKDMKKLKNVKIKKILAFTVALALTMSCMPSAYTISADEIFGDGTEELFTDGTEDSVWTAEEVISDSDSADQEQQVQPAIQPQHHPQHHRVAFPLGTQSRGFFAFSL